MTPDELRALGERLYGERWQSRLAEALPVSVRTVRRWLAGDRKIHPALAARIRDLASSHASRVTRRPAASPAQDSED